MTTYIYLHGFNSGFTRENPKIPVLEKIGIVHGITYDTTTPMEMAIEEIINQLPDDLTDTVLIGTSLGAFYAAEISRLLGLPAVLINPCIDPGNSLRKFVNQLHKNFVTGDESYFGDNTLSTFKGHLIHPYGRIKPLVFVDMADELIPAQTTIDYFEKMGIAVIAFEGGSHRFDHMEEALPAIKKYANFVSFL